MRSSNTRYIEKLDHLRFFAAALVILFHTQLTTSGSARFDLFSIPLIKEGHIGVQLFMVISGFILSIITFNHQIDTYKFYYNRILRIYPLLVFVVALGYYSTSDPRPTSASIDFFVALLPISNMSRLEYGNFGGQLWSVAVEMQFYFIFPILQSMMLREGPKYAIYLISFMVLVRFIVYCLNTTVHQLSYFSIFGELDVFLMGSVCGWYYAQGRINLHRSRWVIGIFVFLNVLIPVLFHGGGFYHVGNPAPSSHWLWIIWPDMIGLVFCALVPAYIQCNLKIPFSKILALGGKYSYSMYIWHIIFISILSNTNIVSINSYLSGVILLFITFIFSAFSYHMIEAPFLLKRIKYVRALPTIEAEQLIGTETRTPLVPGV